MLAQTLRAGRLTAVWVPSPALDSAPDILVAINKLLAKEGRRPLTLEEVSAMIGDGAPKLVERAMNATGEGDAPEDLPTLTGRFLGFYEGHTTDLTRPYPGRQRLSNACDLPACGWGFAPTNRSGRPENCYETCVLPLFPGRVRWRYGGGRQKAGSTADPCRSRCARRQTCGSRDGWRCCERRRRRPVCRNSGDPACRRLHPCACQRARCRLCHH